MKPIRVLAIVITALAALASAASAQNFPTKPVKIVVGFLSGGGVDVVLRVFTPKLSEIWGQQVIVENKPGSGGVVGTTAVVGAEPDGYTLVFSPPGPVSYNGFLYKDMPYDPATQLAPVSIVGQTVNYLIVGKDSKFNSLADLIAYGKANPGKLNYASQGNATTPHITGALLGVRAGVEMVHIPYRGFQPAAADLVSGQIDFMFADGSNTLPQLRAGRAKVLAVAAKQRTKELPDVPTMPELGFPDVVSTVWMSLAAPAKTPPAIIKKIRDDVARAVNDPVVAERFANLSIETVASTPEQMGRHVAAEIAHWREVIRVTGVKAE
jgi:tripartite-type tricarboxylate transporter receptor subunit TctC